MVALKPKQKILTDEINNLFTDAYRIFYELVVNITNIKINDIEIAKNLTQDVFILFLQKLQNGKFLSDMKESDKKINKWLLSSLQNVMYNHFREVRKMANEIALAEAYDNISLSFTNGMRETRLIIEEALEILSDDELPIFHYIADLNYSYQRTGEILGLTRRQIERRYFTIVRKIIIYLKEKKGINSLEDLL